MSAPPRILDLFSGAGGAAMGYHRAGFEVVGVDIVPQPNYPFEFHQADAMELAWELGRDRGLAAQYAAVHASPPCQGETTLAALQDRSYERLLVPTLDAFSRLTMPWVVENVDNAFAPADVYKVRLCGSSFGLRVRRHRWFWSNVALMVPECNHRAQGQPLGVYGLGGGGQMTRGRKATRLEAPEAMGIDWMPHDRLVQAIPPDFTEFIGRQLLEALE